MTEPLGHLDPKQAKRVAANCNNEAWDILELDNPDLEQIARLVVCAGTAQFHWNTVGTENALQLARVTLSHFEKCSSADWEMAFAHAAVAAGSMASKDKEGFRRHYLKAEAIGKKLTGPEASHFNAAFRTLSAAVAK